MGSGAALLGATEAARGPLGAVEGCAAVATAAWRSERAAALFAAADGASLRLHVANRGGSSRRELVELLGGGERHVADEDAWALAWSADGKALAVVGAVASAEDGDGEQQEATLWVYAAPEWMGVEASGPPLLISARVSDYLPAKRWRPAARVVDAFFVKNRLLLVSEDAVVVAVDIQTARLAVLVADDAAPTKEEAKRVFKMSVVKNVAEWHAGTTAASFDPQTNTLVLTGGVRNPSDDLVAGKASSLSVWNISEDPKASEMMELLDYTMVLNPPVEGEDSETPTDAEQLEQDSTSDLAKSAAKSSFLNPLKFMVGAGARSESPSLAGEIRQLAISTNGKYVAILDGKNKIAVRDIEACADVVGWQSTTSIFAGSEERDDSVGVKGIIWLGPARMMILLANSKIIVAEMKLTTSAQDETSSKMGSLCSIPGYFHAPTLGKTTAQGWSARTLSKIAATGPHGYLCSAVVTVESSWVCAVFEQLSVSQFIESLARTGQINEALAIVGRHDLADGTVNMDELHRRVWSDFCAFASIPITSDDEDMKLILPSSLGPHRPKVLFLQTRGLSVEASVHSFADALHYLGRVDDPWWVLDECLRSVATDSFDAMKQILSTGWSAIRKINDAALTRALSNDMSAELASRKSQILRSLYRLESLRLIVLEEERADASVDLETGDADSLFNGSAYLWFMNNSLLDIATKLAFQGRVLALSVLFRRHALNLLPFRLQILSKIPASLSPLSYAHLIPAIVGDASDSQFFSLAKISTRLPINLKDFESEHAADVAEVELVPENRSYDLTPEELALFERTSQLTNSERAEEYAAWFRMRILELDSVYGHLSAAYELGCLSQRCLSGWTSNGGAKRELSDFVRVVERLYKCAHLFARELPVCSKLTLSEWMATPFYQQAMLVVGKVELVPAAIERLQLVILSQRHDRLYALDELLSWIAQTVLFDNPSLLSLELCAQIIQLSKPSLPLQDRWIQSDSHLLRTAISVVFAPQLATVIGLASQQAHPRVQHTALTELLWGIFQSLPVRKDDDPPDISHLQVEVDEVEDLMIAMEVLAKYGILTTPGELKKDVQSSETNGPHELLEQMCVRFLVPSVGSTVVAAPTGEVAPTTNQWMEVWQDAIKLKQHVFGERIVQEDILDTILRHLLAHDVFLDSAFDLMVNWILSSVEATDHVMMAILKCLQSRLDSPCEFLSRDPPHASDAVAAKYIEMLYAIVALPAVQEWDPLRSERLGELLQVEIDLVYASQLLSLLSSGTVTQLPSSLRAASSTAERLDLVVQVLTSNPANYKISESAKQWFHAHLPAGDAMALCNDDLQPLGAILFLATLLQVTSFENEILMKGAYAALYCSDFDMANTLTGRVIAGNEASGESASVPLLHVVSLVLDLVSASSFRSWTKKITLCRAVFSMKGDSANGSDDLFAHQVTDLVLSWLQKLEAIQDLALELGLSERDVEKRLAADSELTAVGVEGILLKELDVVIELLQEEKRDRAFLLRLLEKGFHLFSVTVALDVEALTSGSNSPKESEADPTRFADGVVRLARFCLEEGVRIELDGNSELATAKSYLDLGLGHLLLWNDLCPDDDAVTQLWEYDLLPWLFDEVSKSSGSSLAKRERVISRFHHYFLYVAAAMEIRVSAPDLESTWRARRDRLETFAASYESLKLHLSQTLTRGDSVVGVDDFEVDDQPNLSFRSIEARHSSRFKVLMGLATKCKAHLTSQQKNQEMEEVSAFFNGALDVEAFETDVQYRTQQILWLATKREHYGAATNFAVKYGIDEYQCTLAYIRSALIPTSATRTVGTSRHEQLESAFQTDTTDFLELALQHPAEFGDFLLRDFDGASVYAALDGTDHVGVLFVLRMVLECSKRLEVQEAPDTVADGTSLRFPLSKRLVDRITLVFMCMKRLKDVYDTRENSGDFVIDLKLICRATTTEDLLTVPDLDSPLARTNRQEAVQAAIPLLTGKSVKIVTKILLKLHRVTASSIVMVFLNSLLDSIWTEHAGTADDNVLTDLAAYAYESCHPFLSVLSNEHLILFVSMLLGKRHSSAIDLTEDFYYQPIERIARFAPIVADSKRVDIASDALLLLHTRFEALRSSAAPDDADQVAALEAKTVELEDMQAELVEACVWMLLGELKRSEGEHTNGDTPLSTFESTWKTWRAMDDDSRQLDARQYVEELIALLFATSSLSSVSVRMVVLVSELLLFLARISEQDATQIIAERVRSAIFELAHQALIDSGTNGENGHWTTEYARALATQFSSVIECTPMALLSRYLSSYTCMQSGNPDLTDDAYYTTVQRLGELSSPFLRAASAIRLEARVARQPLALEAAAATTALGTWNDVVMELEARGEWAQAAIASQILVDALPQPAAGSSDVVTRHFGLILRAIWTMVLTPDVLAATPIVFEGPARAVAEQLVDIFETLLVWIQDNGESQKAQAATLAVSKMLFCLNDLLITDDDSKLPSSRLWAEEQHRAVATRIDAQFNIGESEKPAVSDGVANALLWSELLVRGSWGDDLLVEWYEQQAFGMLTGEAIEQFVVARWETHRYAAVALLLMCPFDELRIKFESQIFASIVPVLESAVDRRSTILELSMLRFDVRVLFHIVGLYPQVVAFLLPTERGKRHALRWRGVWTSSSDYAVCALVAGGEYAAAGRLACALWRVHPMLWDFENAQLVLGNMVRSMATSAPKRQQLNKLRRQVYEATRAHLERERLL